ncbi:Peptide-methionine (S)-S-oxide reductase protein [Dioscorea alata]|uniref:Peptide-methionine (S)-S-oxide reductase protein n=1 Tax=Dioscorea alata TaxID=55571 RepID=A0ACB7W562_DIOAL|nr:Peptide-methionine (S)-S-oxide reductase protein [Dioscorea alata]
MYKLLAQSKAQVHDDYIFPNSDQLPPPEFLREAIFAADSFWDLELAFGCADGVLRTATGYYGGSLVKPRYREVVERKTGHTEAVRVIYDKRKTSYRSLLNVFWTSHDPTKKAYLEFGVSTHYRSTIFYGNEEEKKQAHESKVQQQMKLNRRIVTKILPCSMNNNGEFYMAESHHQKYYLQRDYIKLCEALSLRSAEQFADSHIACKLNGILSGGKEKVAVEELKRLIERDEISHETKILLGGIIQDLSVKKALEN